MARTLCYLIALIGVIVLLVRHPRLMGRTVHAGVPVLLAHQCPADAIGDRRDVVVRYLPGARLWLNGNALDRTTLRKQVTEAMETRRERLVWLAADEHVSYGEVASIASDLMNDTPNLHLAIATKSQAGPVEPAEIDKLVQRDPYAFIHEHLGVWELCVGVGGTN
jgi:biopolymer transport protein ExbD